jgi:SAM-dependent methyltransferase
MSTLAKPTETDRTMVQDFYEQNPYPRPVDSLDSYRELWNDRDRLRADYHLFWPAKKFREDHSILIAGCGTSQAAKHAIRWPHAKIVGIDFSVASLESTAELKNRYRLDNLELLHLPLEQARDLETSFDQIVCTGVLHHLPDPEVGLKALRNVLKHDGSLHLMVYAPYGRAGIYLLQDFCRRLGIAASEDGIRDLVAALDFLPPGHPLLPLLNEAPDFQHNAAIADALLNPQDRAYSVPQLFDLLDNCGMKFGRWIKQAPYSSYCGAIAQLPQASKLADLSPTEQYAAVELFRGTMVSHSVVTHRSDGSHGSRIGDLTNDGLEDLVPIRMSDTICVRERLPEGFNAVLINPYHTFRDIYLPITEEEDHLFDAIDGRRTIAEIVGELPQLTQAQHSRAAVFFKRLWWYDQIVFDGSLS